MINQLIERLDRWLKANRADYYARLQPGVSDAALDAFEDRFAARLPASFRALYRWRNGQEPNCTASIQGNRMFSSLDEVAECKATLDGLVGFDFDDPQWWRRSWIPFLANGGGDFLCLDLAAEDGATPGQLVAFWHDDERRPVEYAGFDDWLLKVVESMEAGTLKVV